MAAGRRKNTLLSHYRKKHKVKRQNRIVILVVIMLCILALMNTSESDMLQKMRDWAEKSFSETGRRTVPQDPASPASARKRTPAEFSPAPER